MAGREPTPGGCLFPRMMSSHRAFFLAEMPGVCRLDHAGSTTGTCERTHHRWRAGAKPMVETASRWSDSIDPQPPEARVASSRRREGTERYQPYPFRHAYGPARDRLGEESVQGQAAGGGVGGPGGVARVYAKRPSSAPRTGRVWEVAGVLPVPYHFYQPILRPSEVPVWGSEDPLLGLDLRPEAELRLLAELARFAPEVAAIPRGPSPMRRPHFDYGNESFSSGDAEVLYEMVRLFRPAKVVEVGAGHSTRLIRLALVANARDGYDCSHTSSNRTPSPG